MKSESGRELSFLVEIRWSTFESELAKSNTFQNYWPREVSLSNLAFIQRTSCTIPPVQYPGHLFFILGHNTGPHTCPSYLAFIHGLHICPSYLAFIFCLHTWLSVGFMPHSTFSIQNARRRQCFKEKLSWSWSSWSWFSFLNCFHSKISNEIRIIWNTNKTRVHDLWL